MVNVQQATTLQEIWRTSLLKEEPGMAKANLRPRGRQPLLRMVALAQRLLRSDLQSSRKPTASNWRLPLSCQDKDNRLQHQQHQPKHLQ